MNKHLRQGIVAAFAATALLLGTALPAQAETQQQLENLPLGHNDLAFPSAGISAPQEGRLAASDRAALPEDNEVVQIPDPVLRAKIGIQLGTTITRGTMRQLQSLSVSNSGITDLTGLEYASNLAIVDLSRNPITSIEPLRGLARMAQLDVSRTKISNIDAVSTMPKINYLQVNWTDVSDLTPVSGKAELWRIELAATKVSSLEPLRDDAGLQEVYFQETLVSDIHPLASLRQLRVLSAPDTDISDLSPIAGLPELTLLNVNSAKVSDLSMLDTWPRLRTVGFEEQRVMGVPAVASVTESTYRRPVSTTDPFKMLPGVVLTTTADATTASDGITMWSPLPANNELKAKVVGDPGPGSGATYSANITYTLSRADITNTPRKAAVNKPYSFQFSVTDGFIEGPFEMVSGGVPGLTLSNTGELRGTPTQQGIFPMVITRTDAYGNVITRSFNLVVGDKADLVTVSFDSAGGTDIAPVEVEYGDVVSAPGKPVRDGYEFGEWTLNGVPYDFSMPVSSSMTLVASWDVVAPPKPVPPTIKPDSLPAGMVGKAYSATITASGDGKPTLEITAGALPTGLKFDAKTGKISGTPTKAGIFRFTVTSNNSGAIATKNYAIAVTIETLTDLPCMEPRKVPVFADTPLSHKFYKEIDWMECMKYSTGWRQPAGKPLYKPQDNLERQAMAAFIYRMEAPKGYVAPAVSPFADVKPTDSFYKEMAWMYEMKYSTGWAEPSGKPTYRPHEPLSREAMAAFIYRLEASKDAAAKNYKAPAKSPMADMKPGMKFYKEISWMYDTKLSTGNKVGDTKEYWPKDDLSRQAMAAFIYRLVTEYRK
ncbi:hypothetical protein G7068_11080 [Leucobacter viscericola]|uniref:SLH domain-containing protein n=1 Tax=Leucobacter viscericola TaxID=2714935 RepID=A0A6G7XGT0_9MICO|nr:putative Ig domain-containing protein [Leucobacter viscericola]QIK63676.1 hypothetical protein G7068_11080 [Leucobacter viscericola]